MSFDFPKEAAQLIFDGWEEVGFAPGYEPSPQPSLGTLTALLENCFFASFKREEDRITQFNLALCLPSNLPEPSFRFSKFTKVFNLIPFEQRELSVNELVRLSPACNPEKTVILCGFDEKTGKVFLWEWQMWAGDHQYRICV